MPVLFEINFVFKISAQRVVVALKQGALKFFEGFIAVHIN